MCVHEDHVFKEPEEGPRVVLPELQQLQDAVELKEQPAGALCRTEGQALCVQFDQGKKLLSLGPGGSSFLLPTVEAFPEGVDDGEVVAGAAANQQIKRTPLRNLLVQGHRGM